MDPDDYTIELGPMGPIGEGAALMLRVNRNCPWNRCLFCPVYKGEKFSARSAAEIKADIEKIRRVADLLESTSWNLGLGGRIQPEVVQAAIQSSPGVYGNFFLGISREQSLALRTLSNAANWLTQGAARVFLQDANALFMKPADLIDVLGYLKKCFPSVSTVTAYARSRTCARRSSGELKELHDAGLSWCFVGIESGCDEALDFMEKGASREDHLSGGRKLMASGIEMAAFVMPGLGGASEERSRRHIRETLSVLNEVKPTEVRVRSLAVLEGAPLHARWKTGAFRAPNDDRMVEEMRELIEGIEFDCSFETLQMTNVFTFRGKLPAMREAFLASIREYESMSRLDRAEFLFRRYSRGGYLGLVRSWGESDASLESLVQTAGRALQEREPDAAEKVDRAVFAIKLKGIP